jgi:hypothetical protein
MSLGGLSIAPVAKDGLVACTAFSWIAARTSTRKNSFRFPPLAGAARYEAKRDLREDAEDENQHD